MKLRVGTREEILFSRHSCGVLEKLLVKCLVQWVGLCCLWCATVPQSREQTILGNGSFISEDRGKTFFKNQMLRWEKRSCFEHFSAKSIFGSGFFFMGISELPHLIYNIGEWCIPSIWIPNQTSIFCVCESASFCHLTLKIHRNITEKAVLSPRLSFPKKNQQLSYCRLPKDCPGK